jgi:PAS domain S-box-containing protein
MGLAIITTQGNPEAIPFLIAAAVATAIATLAWHRRSVPGGTALFIMMAGEAGWALCAAAELLIVNLPIKQLCFSLKAGAAILAILGLVTFVLRYTGHTGWLSSWIYGVICTLAVAPLSLAWTNDLHHLYWSNIGIRTCVQRYGTFKILVSSYGPVFWLHFGYCYLLIASSVTLLANAVARSAGIYRIQASVMLFGVLLPWAVNVVDMAQLIGYIHIDAAAVAFAVTGLAMLPAFYRYGLLDLVPIAWAEVVRRMVDPVVVLDSSKRIVAFNDAARELFPADIAEVIGLEAASAFRSWPALADRLADVGGLGLLQFDLESDDRTGGRLFEARVSRLDDAGQPAGWVVALRDVTERRRAETEHTARITAEASDRAKQRFLAVLSHELRTPLTPMLALADSLLSDPATPANLHPALVIFRRNAELEARLIDDLLDFTRVCHGRLQLNTDLIDAHVPIRHALEVCDVDFRAKGLGLEVDLAAGASYVACDPARLQQVAWNLVKNAIKFTPAGGRVAVRTRNCAAQDAGGRPWLILEVADTGVGIDSTFLPRVFDAFEQGDRETARRSGGLGLGLAICRGIVEAHGGRIAAFSRGESRGAMFRVELATAPAAAFPEPSFGPTNGFTARPMLRVLLVEDNPDSREAVSRLLRGEGFATETACDLRSAIELASSGDFDVLVSDIGLPDGSGLDLMRTLRDRGRRSIAGIAISGYGHAEDIRLSLEAGFAAHLVKPLTIRELSASIFRAVGV